MDQASAKNNYHYNKALRPLANRLRKNMTKSEACMWKYVLMNRQMMGYQFRRQRPVLNYIADFMCKDLRLIIEVDGLTHEDELKHQQDKRRDQELTNNGFTVLRFHSWQVLNHIADVSNAICEWIEANKTVEPPGPRKRKPRIDRKRI